MITFAPIEASKRRRSLIGAPSNFANTPIESGILITWEENGAKSYNIYIDDALVNNVPQGEGASWSYDSIPNGTFKRVKIRSLNENNTPGTGLSLTGYAFWDMSQWGVELNGGSTNNFGVSWNERPIPKPPLISFLTRMQNEPNTEINQGSVSGNVTEILPTTLFGGPSGQPNTLYYVEMYANSGSTVGQSASIIKPTAPTDVQNFAYSEEETAEHVKFMFSWDEYLEGDAPFTYAIYSGISSDFQDSSVALSDLSMNTGEFFVTPGETYYFWVRVENETAGGLETVLGPISAPNNYQPLGQPTLSVDFAHDMNVLTLVQGDPASYEFIIYKNDMSIVTQPGEETTYYDYDVTPGSSYSYYIVGVSQTGVESSPSNNVGGESYWRVRNLAASNYTNDGFDLNWDNGSPDAWIVQVKLPGLAWVDSSYSNEIISNNETVAGLSPNTTYDARVSSKKSSPEQLFPSEPIVVLTLPVEISAINPTNITESIIDVEWVSPGGDGALTYEVEVQLSGGDWSSLISSGSSEFTVYSASGLASDTTYDIRVRCLNDSGASDWFSTTLTTSSV